MTARTLAWTSFIAIAAFALMAASRLTVLDPVENVTLNVTSPFQGVLSGITRPIADWVNNITDAGTLSEENRRLHIGGRAYLRFDHGWEPLGLQWYRRARQLFLSRFNV